MCFLNKVPIYTVVSRHGGFLQNMVLVATRSPEKVGRRWLLPVALVLALWGYAWPSEEVGFTGFVGLSLPPGCPRGTSKLVLFQAGEVEAPPASKKAGDLFVGSLYEATVVKLQDFGAKLTLGVDKPGFLHISKVKPKGEFLANMSDVMAEKDVIQVGGMDIGDVDLMSPKNLFWPPKNKPGDANTTNTSKHVGFGGVMVFKCGNLWTSLI